LFEDLALRFDEWNDRRNGWPLAALLLFAVVLVFWTARRA
jgi:hypothetical protein